MKTRVLLNIDKRIAGYVWPEGVPVPAVGDSVLIRVDDGSYGATIKSRFFAIGTDPKDGTPLAELHLESAPVDAEATDA